MSKSAGVWKTINCADGSEWKFHLVLRSQELGEEYLSRWKGRGEVVRTGRDVDGLSC